MSFILSILIVANILLDDLKHPNYQVRLDTTKQLLQDRNLSQEDVEHLYSAKLTLEQRSRLRIIIIHKFLEHYVWDQTLSNAAIGMTYTQVSIPDDNIIINSTFIGTPAYAYLEVGDIIKDIDGVAISSGSDLHKQLRNYNAGDWITINVIRHGYEVQVEMPLCPAQGLSQLYLDGQLYQVYEDGIHNIFKRLNSRDD